MSQSDSTKSVALREAPAGELAVTNEGGPITTTEVELKPLAPRSQLLPAVAEAPMSRRRSRPEGGGGCSSSP